MTTAWYGECECGKPRSETGIFIKNPDRCLNCGRDIKWIDFHTIDKTDTVFPGERINESL